MHKLIPLADVVANPFRHMDRYPISEEKIEALMASMDRTGYWENVVGRQKNGKVELAYGHHRWIAFGRKFGKDAKMGLIIKPLSDEDMLHMMADENMQEFGTSAAIEQETVSAVVEAYAAGKIDLEKPKAKAGSIRYAPSFLLDKKDTNDKPYTAEGVARFLGWTQPSGQASARVRSALKVLEELERGTITEEDVEGLGSDQARGLAEGAKGIVDSYTVAVDDDDVEEVRQRGQAKARQTASRVAATLKKKKAKGQVYGTQSVKDEMINARVHRVKPLPTVWRFCRDLAKYLYREFGKRDKLWAKLNEIVRCRDDIDEDSKHEVVMHLQDIVNRFLAVIRALEEMDQKLLTSREDEP
jgi:hypothetical protein